MIKPSEARLVMMVAQESFETQDMNRFCKLIPVVYTDGMMPTASEFPNDGEIWWMLTPQTTRLAKPGMLVVGRIEDAYRYDEDDPTSSRHQVVRESIQEMTAKEGCSIVDIPSSALNSIDEAISSKFRLDIPVLQSAAILLKWRDHLYGPFNIVQDPRAAPHLRKGFSLAVTNTADMTIYQIDVSLLPMVTGGNLVSETIEVSQSAQHRSQGVGLHDVDCNLLLAPGFDQLVRTNAKRLVLETVDRKLIRFAKQCLTRSKRQQLQGLLDDIKLAADDFDNPQELLEALKLARGDSEEIDTAMNAVAKALLESGMLGDDRITGAEREYAEKYVRDKTAELQARVEESVARKREELRNTETALKEVQSKLQKEEALSRAKLELELTDARTKALCEIEKEKVDFDKQKAELGRQQNLLQQNLQKVTQDLRDAGDDVVNRFLTIAPLLGSFGMAREASSSGQRQQTDRKTPEIKTTFNVPIYINATSNDSTEKLSEEAFFERFSRTVAESGFTYRPIDLQRFHLSVKCGDLTVLGGASGTGKSSLPALYAHSVRGAQSNDERSGCLMVNINPSWMDVRDLLGHLNTLEGRFFPSESGLYQHLIIAQEEHRVRNNATGLYLTCLDEMNLSQVEHYFSDFMMVLERRGSGRIIHCFSPETAGLDCPFHAWGKITLSPALRFVGTVNFDETTRLLSDRFLDRINLINLNSSALPSVSAPTGDFTPVSGRMVTLADYDSWQSDNALPPELGSLLDQMRPLLEQLRCPLSPRVYRAICRFVGSATPIMTASRAFDVQVAQRVIPKIRTIVTAKQRGALDALASLLHQSTVCPFEESLTQLDQIRETAGAREWDLGE